MDSELQNFLEQMEARLETSIRTEVQKVHGEVQQVHGEVQQLHGEVQQLHGDIEHVHGEFQQVRTEIQHAKDESIASAREMQTELLRYIANVAEPFNVRMRHLEANCSNLDTAERLRLAAIEERLLRIEKRVLGDNMTP